jgi:hypothetical protein
VRESLNIWVDAVYWAWIFKAYWISVFNMKNWHKLSIGAGFLSLLIVGKGMADGYVDEQLKKAGFYPAPEGSSFSDKLKLIHGSPYNKIQV